MNTVKNKILLGVGIFVALTVFFSTFTIIPEGHKGVLLTFGSANGRVLDSGLNFKIPIAQTVQLMETRILKEEVLSDAGTKDLQSVDVLVALNYRLDSKEVVDIYQNIGDLDSVRVRILEPAIQEVVKAKASTFTADELLTKRSELKEAIDDSITARLADNDVIVTDVSIVNLEYSADFAAAVEAKQVAQQRAQQAELEAQEKVTKATGEAEAQEILERTISDRVLRKMYIEKWDGTLPQVVGADSDILLDLTSDTTQ